MASSWWRQGRQFTSTTTRGIRAHLRELLAFRAGRRGQTNPDEPARPRCHSRSGHEALGVLLAVLFALAPGLAHAQAPRTWPGGRVPVRFLPTITATQQARFFHACAEWTAVAPVACVPAEPIEVAWLEVTDYVAGCGYFHAVGAPRAGAAVLNLQAYCWGGVFLDDVPVSYQTIAHEIGHALGLIHEHQRADRDQFVAVHPEHVQAAHLSDFARLDDVPLLAPYDFGSIMHYQPWTWSNGSGPTVQPRAPYAATVSLGGIVPSAGDAAKLRALYGTPAVGAPAAPLVRVINGATNPVRIAWTPGPGAAPTAYLLRAGTTPGGADLAVLEVGSQTAVTATAPTGVTIYVTIVALNEAGYAAADPVLIYVPR